MPGDKYHGCIYEIQAKTSKHFVFSPKCFQGLWIISFYTSGQKPLLTVFNVTSRSFLQSSEFFPQQIRLFVLT